MKLFILIESLMETVDLERLAEHASCSIEVHDGPLFGIAQPVFLASDRIAPEPWSDDLAAISRLWRRIRTWVAELDGLGRIIYQRTGATLRFLTMQYEDESGVRGWVPITGSCHMVAPAMMTMGMQTAHDPVRARLTLLAPTLSRPEVAAVLAAWGARDRYDWVSLYKIYELIRCDGGRVEYAGMTESWLRSFAESANDPVLSGEAARHAVRTRDPRNEALSLADAEQGMRRWTLGWIEAKAAS